MNVWRKLLMLCATWAALAHAAALARPHGATLHLLHVEEGATSQLFGAQSSTEEIRSGEEYFSGIVEALRKVYGAQKLVQELGLQ